MTTDDLAFAYALPEVGRRLGVSTDTVQRMVRAGDLPCISVWGKRRVTHRALLAYLAARETPVRLVERRAR